MFCRNKKFCSVKSRFPVHLPLQILDNIGSLPFISWAISMKFSGYCFSCLSTDVPSFVEKYPKIKFLTGPIGGNWTLVKHLFYY
jgi:hypothetical protein